MVRFTLLLMLSILTLVSCGDDDDNGAPFMDDSLVGTWNITTYDTDLNVEIQGFPGGETIVSTLVSSDAMITFATGGTWTSTGEAEFMVTEGDSTYTEAGDLSDGGVWTVAGQTVTITSSNPDESAIAAEEFTVVTYESDAKVELTSNVDESITDPFFGLVITTTGKVDLTLEQ